MTEYSDYLRAEWRRYAEEPDRAREVERLLDEIGRPRGRVLDVGCGAGQELLPFVARGWSAVGLDLAAESGACGRRLFAQAGAPGVSPAFVRARAEALPFATAAFDVVVCRIALPYTDNRSAISEMARVLSPGGLLRLKLHAPGYYLRKAWLGLRSGRVRSTAHALRVLANGLWFHLSGRQPRPGPRNSSLGSETWLSRAGARRLLAAYGLELAGESGDSSRATPAFLCRRV